MAYTPFPITPVPVPAAGRLVGPQRPDRPVGRRRPPDVSDHWSGRGAGRGSMDEGRVAPHGRVFRPTMTTAITDSRFRFGGHQGIKVAATGLAGDDGACGGGATDKCGCGR